MCRWLAPPVIVCMAWPGMTAMRLRAGAGFVSGPCGWVVCLPDPLDERPGAHRADPHLLAERLGGDRAAVLDAVFLVDLPRPRQQVIQPCHRYRGVAAACPAGTGLAGDPGPDQVAVIGPSRAVWHGFCLAGLFPGHGLAGRHGV